MNNSMINPSIVDLLKKVDNRYSLVVAAAKRARQIIDGREILIETNSNKPVTIAVQEIDKSAIQIESDREGII